MSIERLRALEKKWREDVAAIKATIKTTHWSEADCLHIERGTIERMARELSDLIAELGHEVGAVAPVAFAVELADGSIGKLGWMDYSSFDLCTGVSELREGCRYVYAYRTSPAHASEARDAARYRWLKDHAVFGSMASRDHSLALNCDEPASAWDEAIDAAMRQEGE